jgi:ABC-type Mn2+/Zn2+ transport system ATPase subunit
LFSLQPKDAKRIIAPLTIFLSLIGALMGHRLKFRNPYNSIKEFPDADVPDFVLITGRNGVGKSHLLDAIAQGHILTTAAASSDIRTYNWSNFVPQESQAIGRDTLSVERTNYLQQFKQMRHYADMQANQVRTVLYGSGFTGYDYNNANMKAVLELSDNELLRYNISSPDQFRSDLTNAIANAEQAILAQFAGIPFLTNALKEIALKSNVPVFLVTEAQIEKSSVAQWGAADILQLNFGRLFAAYRELELRNKTNFYNKTIKGEAVEYLEEAKFQEIYGVPPWEFVNTVLAQAALPFAFSAPPELDHFTPILKHLQLDIPLPFSSLSSGEKILISFAFCLYQAKDGRQQSVYPKVLLFDEIDAPLHPAMSKHVLDVITEILVGKYGIKIIATTHSPTTVALAPEDSLYTLERGEPGLHKVSKDQALKILTVGLPSLSISLEDRRQVFVEGNSDYLVYSALYETIKNQVSGPVSLQFIAAGVKDQGSNQVFNSGCETVRKLVHELEQGGNKSVYGLLDWDGKNESSRRIFVLADKMANGLENVILNPISLLMLITQDHKDRLGQVGLAMDLTFSSLSNLPECELQPFVDKLCGILLGDDSAGAMVEVARGIQVPSRLLMMDDHEYERLVLDKFNFLRGTKPLHTRVIEKVYRERPDFIPKPIVEIFTLLSAVE